MHLSNGKGWMKILAVIAALLVVFLVLVWKGQRRLIYLPLEHHVPPAAVVLPGAEEVTFETEDGLTLHAWFLPAAAPPPRPTVLVFHGNAGHRADRAPLAAALRELGISTLLVDYRGYAENPGRPSEKGLAADARAARRYVLTREDVDAQRLIYFGESIGSGVALGLAVEQEPAALVLRSPFTSLTDVARLHYPFLPVRLLLADRYPSIDRIARFDGPLLIIAGARDRIVPPEQSRRLYDASSSRQKRFLLIDGADHNDMTLLAGSELIDAMRRIVQEIRPGDAT